MNMACPRGKPAKLGITSAVVSLQEMAKIVNFRNFIKDKDRARRARAASENAAKHGRTKEERALDKARADKLVNDLDQQKRDDP